MYVIIAEYVGIEAFRKEDREFVRMWAQAPHSTRQWITQKHIFDEYESNVTKEVRALSKIWGRTYSRRTQAHDSDWLGGKKIPELA